MNLTLILTLTLTLILHITKSTNATTFTFTNKCSYTVWPGTLSNANSPPFPTTGFELPTSSSQSFQAPSGWSGRFWGRTGCNFSPSSSSPAGYCSTGDCGSGTAECNGAGAEPPATLAEFTLGPIGNDFYDVSLVDGYNLPMLVETSGGAGQCASTGCVVDLNRGCPSELRVGSGDGCKSACEAFGRAEYCCSGEYGTPASCRPSVYSQMFKSACPRSYSYAYDDASSTFTCAGADYVITFCPVSSTSQKSTTAPPDFTGSYPTGTTPTTGSDPMGTTTTPTGSGADMTYGSATDGVPGAYGTPSTETVSGTGTTTSAMLSDGSWLAGLAAGGSSATQPGLLLGLGFSIFGLGVTMFSVV